MCKFYDNEIFDNVIDGEYYSTEGFRIRGAFTTKDDAAVVINVNVLEKLLSGVEYHEDFTLEEAEEKFGQQIIERYLKRNNIKPEQISLNKSEVAKRNLEIARASRKKNVAYNQALILREILLGSTKTDTAYNLGISIATVTRALKDLTQDKLNEMFSTFRGTALSDIDRGLIVNYIVAGCSYQGYRKKLALDSETKRLEAEKKEKIAMRKQQVEQDAYEKAQENKKVISEKLVEMGFKPLVEEPIKEAKPKKIEEDIAVSFEDIMQMFEKPERESVYIERKIDSEVAEAQAAKLSQGYSSRTSLDEILATSQPEKRRIQPKFGVIAHEEAVSDVHEADSSWGEFEDAED